MPQFYSVLTTGAIVASSSGSGYYTFGFHASQVTIENLAAANIWAKFDACSTAASTSDPLITTCDDARVKTFQFTDWRPVHQVTIFATSTTAGAVQFGITAMG